MEEIVVLDRITERHPNVSKEDAKEAWISLIACVPAIDMNPNRYMGIGTDRKGRLIELVAILKKNGNVLIIHAQTPPQKKIIHALGIQIERIDRNGR